MNLFEKHNLIIEQGPPPGMPGMPGMGGPGGAPAPSIDDKFFDKIKGYPKVDVFIQQMQQEGSADSRILDELYKKFYPEMVYFAKELLQSENKPKPEGGPGGPGGMPGAMPGAGAAPMGGGAP